ncbi:MAG: GNAT family N-acetyltransferase [Promethearchaeota archaeon]
MLTFKHYEKGFEIEQERINMTVAKNWSYPRVITVDQLREKYYKDDFDPQTVLYCFDDNNDMIGFVTSQILQKENEIVRARLSFPIVLPGYEDAIELLFERAIKVLKDKNIQIVHSSFGLWGGSNEWAEKWGYKRIDEIGVLYGLDVNSNTFNEETEDVISFDPETDLDDCVNLFVTEYNLPEDDVRNFTRYIFTNEDTLAYFVLREKGEIVATGAIMKNRIVSTIGLLSAVHDKGINYLRKLLSKLINVAKGQGIEKIFMFFTHLPPDHPIIEKYITLGFTFLGSNVNYEKKI